MSSEETEREEIISARKKLVRLSVERNWKQTLALTEMSLSLLRKMQVEGRNRLEQIFSTTDIPALVDGNEINIHKVKEFEDVVAAYKFNTMYMPKVLHFIFAGKPIWHAIRANRASKKIMDSHDVSEYGVLALVWYADLCSKLPEAEARVLKMKQLTASYAAD
jgi:superfamily II DNA helicase RecQ